MTLEYCQVQLDGFDDVSEVLRCGVYALCWRGSVVYVGQSKKMLARVYAHANMYLRKQKDCTIARYIPVRGIRFDEVFVRPCLNSDLDRLEREMIGKYNPVYNIHYRPRKTKEFPRHLFVTKPEPSIGVLRRI